MQSRVGVPCLLCYVQPDLQSSEREKPAKSVLTDDPWAALSEEEIIAKKKERDLSSPFGKQAMTILKAQTSNICECLFSLISCK